MPEVSSSTEPIANSNHFSIGEISYDLTQLLKSGDFSQLYSGTLGERSVAVEKLKTAWVDPTMTETLLALNHMNVVKVLHTEQEALYRYRHTVQFHSFSKCLIFN